MTIVHAEIEYRLDDYNVHSDICPPECKSENINHVYKNGSTYREFLHKCLDEWLDESNGTGGFYIKEEGYEF